eukprot:5051426-Amphidinium_carterae.1
MAYWVVGLKVERNNAGKSGHRKNFAQRVAREADHAASSTACESTSQVTTTHAHAQRWKMFYDASNGANDEIQTAGQRVHGPGQASFKMSAKTLLMFS